MCFFCSASRSFCFSDVDRLTVQLVLAAPVGVVHAEDVKERRLPRSRRPHDRDELAGLDVEVDAPKQKRFARAGFHGFFEILEVCIITDTSGQ